MVNELVIMTQLARGQRVAVSEKEASEANGNATDAKHDDEGQHRDAQAMAAT